jgi:hypothetical protein
MRRINFGQMAGLIATTACVTAGLLAPTSTAGARTARRWTPAMAARSSYVPQVLPSGQIPSPPWWKGTCDNKRSGADPSSAPLGASWDGLVACGPGPNEGGHDSLVSFYPGAWGEFEWECVELSMRWMYLAWGVPPYPANGGQVVDNYAKYNPNGPSLEVVKNGSKGVPPEPGDVLELNDNDAFGHTEVVTATSVNHLGDGTVRVMTENLNSPTNGWAVLPVSNWVVSGDFGTVVDWLHNPAWELEEPLVGELNQQGQLALKQGGLRGSFTRVVSSGVAQAAVVGAGGEERAPLVVVLTTGGILEAAYDLPQMSWQKIATGVKSFQATSSEGAGGAPTIGWLTKTGLFYVVSGGLTRPPLLEATHVRSIAVGSDSASQAPLIGYVNDAYHAFVRDGTGAFELVSAAASSLSLAASGPDKSGVLEGVITTNGRALLRSGPTGAFKPVGPTTPHSVTKLALATVGPKAAPLVSYLTPGGKAYASYDGSAFIHELSGAKDIVVAGGHNAGAYPLFGVETATGSWLAKSVGLSRGFIPEGTALQMYLSALVVS